MQVLVDTYVWSQGLRRTNNNSNDPARELRDIISDNRVLHYWSDTTGNSFWRSS